MAPLRASAALPIDRLRDEAEEYFRSFPGRSRNFDLELLAAAMLHFDLAGVAGMALEKNEDIALSFLNGVSDGRRRGWSLDAHLGLIGLHVDGGRLGDAVRVAKVLHQEYPQDRAVLHARARLAHLTLRAGDPEDALRQLDAAGDGPSAVQRFVALLLRGETLLWLGRTAEAERAFSEAQAIHLGAVSAAGLAAARQTLGDRAGAAEAARGFLGASRGEDTWWRFLVQALADESRRLDQLRGPVLDRR